MTTPPLDPQQIIDLLGLQPLPQEGGFYHETYRATLTIPTDALPDAYEGDRHASTAIYFLITPQECSAMHILPTDEMFHFYAGDPVEMLLLYPDGDAEQRTMGVDLAAGQRPQVLAPGGVWQGCRLRDGGRWALLGCTVAPGFDFRDFHVASHEEIESLAEHFPSHADQVRQLAPKQ